MLDDLEALKALNIQEDVRHLTSSQLRKHYLKAALAAHPDKNQHDKHASEKFARLQEAYTTLLQRISVESDAAQEKAKAQEILDIFIRAMQGENVEFELKNLDAHRPPDLFGIDLAVSFDRRLPAAMPSDEEKHVDLKDAFVEAFADEGLDEEGNPLEGWARPPHVDLEDI